MSILTEAEDLINGARHEDYGSPLADFTLIAELWTPILGVSVLPEDVALCMVQLKIARELNKPKRDNLVDAAGYLGCIEIMQSERAQKPDSAENDSDAAQNPKKNTDQSGLKSETLFS